MDLDSRSLLVTSDGITVATLAFTNPGEDLEKFLEFTIFVGVTFCTCLSTMAELVGFTFPTKWLGLAGRAGRGVVLVGVGFEGSFGVLAGELLVREYFLDGDVPDLT